MANTRTWTNEKVEKLQQLYATATWAVLLLEFPEYTATAITRAAQRYRVKQKVPEVPGKRKAPRVGVRKTKLTHDKKLFDAWTERSAYILGYLEADGCVFQNRNLKNPVSVVVQFDMSAKDADFAEKLRGWVGFSGAVRKQEIFHKKTGRIYHARRFMVTSRAWKDFLKKNLRTGKIPNSLPPELLHHYIRGYFDGDGGVWDWKGWIHASFVSSSESLIKDIRDVVATVIGVSLKVCQKSSSSKCWDFRMSKKKQILAFSQWLYRDATMYLDRKYDKLRNLEDKEIEVVQAGLQN